MKTVKMPRSESEKALAQHNAQNNPFDSFTTPYDTIFPEVEDSSAQFYIDAMRLYLALISGSVQMEDAHKAVESLKKNPEFAISPSNPMLIPYKEEYKERIIENMKTLEKFKLYTIDAVRSAYNFSFLMPEVAVSDIDLRVLKFFSKNILATVTKASSTLSIAPRTVSRSITRLSERNSLRFSAVSDNSAFNLHSYLLFFIPTNDESWLNLEEGIKHYPFTKTVLKPATSEIGYIAFLIPGDHNHQKQFKNSIKRVASDYLTYSCLHTQVRTGASSKLSLYNGKAWEYPTEIGTLIESDEILVEEPASYLECKGWLDGLTEEDFTICDILKRNVRFSPSQVSQQLRIQGYEIGARKVANTIKRIQRKEILLPFISYGGLGLTSNFCVEVICNKAWRSKLFTMTPLFPFSMHYESTEGVVLWEQVPSSQQVDYYQFFRSIEQMKGVEEVHPIITVAQKGSRAMGDLAVNMRFGSRGWSVDPELLDLYTYID
jgi:DNA-binding Lrp family transcriptional regulator